MMAKNNLRQLRIEAGVGIEALSAKASLSDSLIEDTETNRFEPLWEVKSRIVIALNDLSDKIHRPQDVFPKKIPSR